MDDIRIAGNEWREFCEDFTRRHRGRRVGIRQLDTRTLVENDRTPAHGPVQLVEGNRPFQELREGRTNGITEFMVTVGEGADETSFLIEDAVALYRRRQGDTPRGVRIDSGNGTTTLVELAG
jgi:hypothetical protein